MMKECPFDSFCECDILTDYHVTHVALLEAEELCSANWDEIRYLLDRVKLLEALLTEEGIDIPE
ncbi:MAG: mobility-associated LCxxNW protein [Lachnospiraceae bacterium]|nr:mobility-associated LCxxNW protein [Lachnospiraceae bacterium]